MNKNYKVAGFMCRFGVVTDAEGNTLTPTINIEGVEVATNKLADWIWQGCKLMEEEYKANRNSARGQHLKDSILDALTIHYKLLGFANDEIDSQIKGWVRMDVPQNVQEEAPIENVALEAYFDYFGAFAPIPSARNTEITDRFVQFYNCNGWLATYDRSTGEFVSEQE